MPSIQILQRGPHSTLNDETPLPSLGNAVSTVGADTRAPSKRTALSILFTIIQNRGLQSLVLQAQNYSSQKISRPPSTI